MRLESARYSRVLRRERRATRRNQVIVDWALATARRRVAVTALLSRMPGFSAKLIRVTGDNEPWHRSSSSGAAVPVRRPDPTASRRPVAPLEVT